MTTENASPRPQDRELRDHTDVPRNFLNTFWPLAALGLILLMLLRACVPGAPSGTSSFGSAAAAVHAGQSRINGLCAVPATAPTAAPLQARKFAAR